MIKESAGKLRIRARLPRRRVWVIGVALVVIGLVPLGVAKLPDLWHAIWHPRQHWIIIGAILAAVGTAFLVASTVRLGWEAARTGGEIGVRDATKAFGTLLVALG